MQTWNLHNWERNTTKVVLPCPYLVSRNCELRNTQNRDFKEKHKTATTRWFYKIYTSHTNHTSTKPINGRWKHRPSPDFVLPLHTFMHSELFTVFLFCNSQSRKSKRRSSTSWNSRSQGFMVSHGTSEQAQA